jgi:glycosyltransferase involved in cell wall biosynthesis
MIETNEPSPSTPDVSELAEAAVRAADNRGVISQAFRIDSFGQSGSRLFVRGWHPAPWDVDRIEIRATSGDLLGEAVFDELRPDVAKKQGTDPGLLYGFNLKLQTPATGIDQFVVDFIDEKGLILSSRTSKATKVAELWIKELTYDEPSRRLGYVGRFNPIMQCRAVVLATKTQEYTITRLFEKNPETHVGRFDWFYGEIMQIGPNDLRSLAFVFTMIDGQKFSVDLSDIEFIRNPTLLEVENANFNFLSGNAQVSGWFRTFENYTHLTISVGNQTLHCMPTAGVSKRIQEKHNFRGPQPFGWNAVVKIEAGLDVPDALLDETHPVVTAKLMARTKVLGSGRLKLRDQQIVTWAVDLCLYNKENSHLSIYGRSTDQRMKEVRVTRRGQFVTKANLMSLSRDMVDPDSHQSWSWTAISEINARLEPGDVLEVEFFDEAGNSLAPEGAAPCGQPLLAVTAPGFIQGHPKYADVVVRATRLPRATELPMLLLVFPGSMAGGGGGGNTRVRELLGFLKNSGFQIGLVDRSELWDVAAASPAYRDLLDYVDFHIPLGPSIAAEVARQTIKALSTRGDTQSKTLHDRLKAALEKGRNVDAPSLIEKRTDEVFNQLASFYALHYRPRLFFTSFVWTTSAFDTLPQGVIRFLDAHDVQSERYESFRNAQERFGEEVVGDIAPYAQDAQEEAKALNKADVVLAISKPEAAAMARLIGTHKVVHAGFALREIDPLPHVADSRKILFVGNKYIPNTFGIQRFVEEVFPQIRAALGDAEIHVCGSVCDELASRIEPQEGVVLRGFVPDLKAEYGSAAIVINPVQFGSGTSVKTPEALGFGKAVVCTPYIAESLPDCEEEGAVVVAELEAMAQPIVDLLCDPEARAALERRAGSYASNRLSNDVVLADLLNIIETKIFY